MKPIVKCILIVIIALVISIICFFSSIGFNKCIKELYNKSIKGLYNDISIHEDNIKILNMQLDSIKNNNNILEKRIAIRDSVLISFKYKIDSLNLVNIHLDSLILKSDIAFYNSEKKSKYDMKQLLEFFKKYKSPQ